MISSQKHKILGVLTVLTISLFMLFAYPSKVIAGAIYPLFGDTVTYVNGKQVTDYTQSLGYYKYTGSPITPTVQIYPTKNHIISGSPLVQGKDYIVEYSNNTNPGIAHIIISGMGDYNGYLDLHFNINYTGAKPTTKPTQYRVTIGETLNGTAALSKSYASSGDKISITLYPNSGYELDLITVNDKIISGTSFTMGSTDTVVCVYFKRSNTRYSITVSDTINGTASVSKHSALVGDEITVTAVPDAGYELDTIKVNNSTIRGTSFKMPAKNTIVTVAFKKLPEYSISVSETNNGTVNLSKNKTYPGDEILVTAIPDEGYGIDSIKVNDNPISGITFTMPNTNVTLSVAFKKVNASGKCGDNLYWTLDGSTLSIFGSGSMYNYDNKSKSPWTGKYYTDVVLYGKMTSIGDYAFSGSYITEISIPNSVITIGKSAFSNCRILSITLPESVTSIGSSAFYESSLKSIALTNNVTSIGNSAFSNSSLTSITIPNSITTIGNGTFNNCDFLISVDLPDGLKTIGNSAFADCARLESVNIPNSVEIIDGQAFYNCRNLKDVTITSSSKLTTIGYSAFYYCEKLESITIPNSVTSIKHHAFDNCYSLTSITIPGNVTNLEYYVFNCCKNLTSVEFSNGITSTGSNTFNGCSNLKKVTIPNSVTTIDQGTFSSCSSLEEIIIPDSVTTIGDSAFSYCGSLKSISIPESVTKLGNNAFASCYALTSVKIPKSITSFGYGAFSLCKNLTSVDLPDGLKTIGNSAFEYCYALTSVNIPKSVTTIGSRAFYYCTGLASITIPSSITTIEYQTFMQCNNLTSISIPSSLKKIAEGAFSECSKLADIYYDGAENEWEKISVGKDNNLLANVTIHYAYYSIKLNEINNGQLSASKNKAKPNEEITLTVTPNNGYDLDTIKINGESIIGTKFRMPEQNVTIDGYFIKHILITTESQAPTCSVDGFETYYECKHCHKLFSDSDGMNEISKPVSINKLGHKLYEIPEKAPSKSESGNIKYYKCERCGKLFSDSKGKNEITKDQTVIPAMVHDLTAVKAVAATCTESGNIAYYICKDDDCKCGKAYSDPYGQHEINLEDTVIPALGHNPEEVAGKDPTCTEDGYEKYYKCSKCNKLFSDAEGKNEIEKPVAISKLGHDMKHIEAKKPTHDDDGHIEYYHCDRCGKNFADEDGNTALTDAEIVVPHIGGAVLGEEITEGDFIYKVTNPRTDGTGTVTIVGLANAIETVNIPATVELKLDTYKVNRIGPKAFYGDKTIKTVYIGNNVVIIDANAFYGCSNLVKVSGGKVLKTIGANAFARCSKLKTFVITSTVLNKIGTYAFNKDSRLKTIYIRNTVKLTKSGVKKSLKGSSVKTVKVKKSKVKKYKKYFKKSNSGRKVKVKK